jgi:hypothetical protein
LPCCDAKGEPFEVKEMGAGVTVRCIRDVGAASSSDTTDALALLDNLGAGMWVGDADRARKIADPRSDLACDSLECERCGSGRGSLWGTGIRETEGDDCDIRETLLEVIKGQAGDEASLPGDGIVCLMMALAGESAFNIRWEDVLHSGLWIADTKSESSKEGSEDWELLLTALDCVSLNDVSDKRRIAFVSDS